MSPKTIKTTKATNKTHLRTADFGGKDWDVTPTELLDQLITVVSAEPVTKTFQGEIRQGYMLGVRLPNGTSVKCLTTNTVLVRTLDDYLKSRNGIFPSGGFETTIVRPKGENYFIFD